MSQQQRKSSAFWPAASLASVPLLYGLLWGPACWLVDRDMISAKKVATLYFPLVRGATSNFRPVAVPLRWYGELYAPHRRKWLSHEDESVVDLMSGVIAMYDDKK